MIVAAVRLMAISTLGIPALLLACDGPPQRGPEPAAVARASESGASRVGTPATGKPVPFTVLFAASTSRLQGERRERVIRDEAAWRAFHADVLGRPGEPVAVNFDAFQVLAVDGEDGSNTCHAIRIEAVRRMADGNLLVHVVRHVPPPGAVCGMAMMRPACAVGVPRTPGPVTFAWRVEASVPAP